MKAVFYTFLVCLKFFVLYKHVAMFKYEIKSKLSILIMKRGSIVVLFSVYNYIKEQQLPYF